MISVTTYAQGDPNDPTSPNYKKNLKSVVTDRWSLSVMAQAGRAMQEFSESYAYYAASATYMLDKGSLTLNADYSHPVDGVTDDTRPWRFGDPSITYNSPMLFDFNIFKQKFNVMSRISYLAPASEASRNSSSYGFLIGTMNAVSSFGRFTLILSPSVFLSYHEYETADVFGFTPNSPLAVRGAATLRAQIIRDVSMTLTGFLHNFWDYESRSKLIQGVSSNLIYQVNTDLSVNAFVSYRDRIVTNNSLFDDDTVQTGFGIIYTF